MSSGSRLGIAAAPRPPRLKRKPSPESMSAAAVAGRCAALMRGGIPPGRVFELLAAESPRDGPLGGIARGIGEGEQVAEAIAATDGPEWRVLAVAWHLAEQSGAPLAAALERIASALHAVAQVRERRSVLLAGPQATVRMVGALPPLTLVLGALLGFDPLPVLLSPAGAALGVFGAALLAAGVLWAGAMTRAVTREDRVAGIELELVWIALGGGAPPSAACLRVVDCVDRLGAEWVAYDGFLRESLLRGTIASAAAAGAPLQPLLVEEAAAARAESQAALERAAEKLGVRVLIPLGVCVLPSFIVLGVVPVLISMLSGSGL
ncbi:MAG: type II secretion system F family protein [Leucobacter sp.]